MPNNGLRVERLVRALFHSKLNIAPTDDINSLGEHLVEFENKFGEKFDNFIENRLVGFVIKEIRKPCEKKGNPVDIELITISNEVFKISVKYLSNCWLNSSPKLFYHNTNRFDLLKNYIYETGVSSILMERATFGKNKEPSYFRLKSRMKSEVENEWFLMREEEHKNIIRRCFHYQITPDFEFYFTKKNLVIMEYGSFFLKKLNNIISNINRVSVSLSRNRDYVFIKYKGEDIGKIQIKFNNGVENKSLRYNFWIIPKFKKKILQRLA